MVNVKKYAGLRVKDGKKVKGYAAIGYESEKAWIMVPCDKGGSWFHIVEVEPDSIIEIGKDEPLTGQENAEG